ALVSIAVQMHGMKTQYGDYTISYISTITYYNYLGAKADCLKKDTVFVPGENARAKYFNKFSSHEQKKLVSDDIRAQLKDNKQNLAKAYVYCLFSNSSKGSYIVSQSSNDEQTAYFDMFKLLFKAVSKIQNIVLTIFGVLLSLYFLIFRKRKSGFHVVTSLLLLYIFFVSGVSCQQGDRFHIVFFALAILLIGGFSENRKAVRNRSDL